MSKVKIRVYKDRSRESRDWRWTMTSVDNGNIIGASSEGYRRRGRALSNLETVTGIKVRAVRGMNGEINRQFELGQRWCTLHG